MTVGTSVLNPRRNYRIDDAEDEKVKLVLDQLSESEETKQLLNLSKGAYGEDQVPTTKFQEYFKPFEDLDFASDDLCAEIATLVKLLQKDGQLKKERLEIYLICSDDDKAVKAGLIVARAIATLPKRIELNSVGAITLYDYHRQRRAIASIGEGDAEQKTSINIHRIEGMNPDNDSLSKNGRKSVAQLFSFIFNQHSETRKEDRELPHIYALLSGGFKSTLTFVVPLLEILSGVITAFLKIKAEDRRSVIDVVLLTAGGGEVITQPLRVMDNATIESLKVVLQKGIEKSSTENRQNISYYRSVFWEKDGQCNSLGNAVLAMLQQLNN